MRFAPRGSLLPYTGLSPYSMSGERLSFVESHTDLGVVIERDLKFHSHIRRKVGVAGGLTSNFLSCTLNRNADFLLSIYKAHIRPILDYASPLWNLEYIGDLKLLEKVQRRWTRSVDDLFEVPYHDRLRRLNLFSYQGRLLRADLIMVWKILHGKCAISPSQLFSPAEYIGTRGHPYKLFLPRSRLDIRTRFFSIRIISTWNSLSQDTVTADTLEKFKGLLHRDLGDLLFQYAD